MDNAVTLLRPLHRLHGHHAVSDLPTSVVQARDLPVGEQLHESPLNGPSIGTFLGLTHTAPITRPRNLSRSSLSRPFLPSNANYHPMRKKKAGSGIQFAGVKFGRP